MPTTITKENPNNENGESGENSKNYIEEFNTYKYNMNLQHSVKLMLDEDSNIINEQKIIPCF